ncbi:MAG: hypothetical protein V2A56_08740 [bacterium]
MRRYQRRKNMSLLLAALLVFGISVVGCDRNAVKPEDFDLTETVDYMIQQGWVELQNGNPDVAVGRFSAAANADATSLEAYLGLGYAYALMNQPSVAMNNFGNVIALAPVLGYASDDVIFAETYAGMAAAYLAASDYTNAIKYALLGEVIWEAKPASEQVHRHLEGFGLVDLRLICAEAYYGDEQYDQALLVVDLVAPGFISSATHILPVTGELRAVTLLQTTATDGIARVSLSHSNLIYPQSASIDGLDYAVVDYTVSGRTVMVQGTPIPAAGDSATVDYLYADDFGLFLIELRDKLQALTQ